jgi:hypothetical protein
MNWLLEDEEKSVSVKSTKIGQSLQQELAIISGKRAKTITEQEGIETEKI